MNIPNIVTAQIEGLSELKELLALAHKQICDLEATLNRIDAMEVKITVHSGWREGCEAHGK